MSIAKAQQGDVTCLYRHYNEKGDLLYVGISLNAVNRSYSHSLTSKWWDEVSSITVERFGSRVAAEAAERAAIHSERPRYNRQRDEPSITDITLYQKESKSHGGVRKWVSDKYLADYFQVSRQSIWRWSRKGVIPEPQRIGVNVTRWDLDECVRMLLSKPGGGEG